MRKFNVIGLALFAAFAFSAFAASSAFAEVHLWLISGADVLTLTLVQIEGELLLSDTKTAFGEVDVLCSGILDGTVGPEGEDEITEVLTLGGVLVTLAAPAFMYEPFRRSAQNRLCRQ